MNLSADFLRKLLTKKDVTLVESIGDLRNRLYCGERLSVEEKTALSNYDRYKAQVLNSENDEKIYHHKYKQLQVISNLGDWREFLKETYF